MTTITTDPDALARIAEKQAAVATARAAERERKKQAQSAANELAKLRSALLAGDDSIPPAEFANATATAEMSKLLLTHAESKTKAAERVARLADLDVAEAVAARIADAFTCSVTVSDKLPPEFDKKKLPHVWVLQDRPTENLGAGYLKGTARVVLVAADRMTTGPDARELGKLCESDGWSAAVGSNPPTETPQNVWLNSRTVSVARGWHPRFPKLTSDPTRPMRAMPSQTLGDSLHNSVYKVTTNDPSGIGALWTVNYEISDGTAAHEVEGGWVQEATIALALIPDENAKAGWANLGGWGQAVGSVARRALNNLRGVFVPGWGVIQAVALGAPAFETSKPGVATFARLTVGFRPDDSDADDLDETEDGDEMDE